VPLYEYTCSGCGEGFTLLQSVNTKPGETLCPACGSAEVERRMSAFAPSVPAGGSDAPPMGGCGQPGGGCGGGMCGQ
jgi:putative FmdB family regulatory protein